MRATDTLLFIWLSCLGVAACSNGTNGSSAPDIEMADSIAAPDTAAVDAETADSVATADTSETVPDLPLDTQPQPFQLPVEPPPWPADKALADPQFLQEFNHTWNENDEGIGELVALVAPPGYFEGWERPTLVAPDGIHRRNLNGNLELVPLPDGDTGPIVAASTALGKVYIATVARLYVVDGSFEISPVADIPEGAQWVRLYGTQAFLDILTSQGWGTLTEGEALQWTGQPVEAIVRTAAGMVLAQQGLLQGFNGQILPPGPPAWTAEVDVGTVRALLPDRTLPQAIDLLVVGTEGIAGLVKNGESFQPVGEPLFQEGRVPLAQAVAATALSDGGFAVAGEGGVYRVLQREYGPEYRVYLPERWMPTGDVKDVLAPEGTVGTLYFATAGGLGWVTQTDWTALDKTAPMVERIVLRHDRDGAVSDSHLTVPGDLTTNIPWDSDNDGGWTCYWVLAECLRHQVTGDPEAKAHFDKSLARMLSYRTLTGTDYFVARAVIRIDGCQLDDCDDPNDGEWFLSPDGDWWVKADTSNDEVTSHMFAMGMAYDLCADDEQKQAIVEHVDGIVGGLVDHGFQLIDPQDGKPTSYGQFDPVYVNWWVEGQLADGGRRSAQILGALNLAHYLTGKQKYLDARNELLDEHHYAKNVDNLGNPEVYPFCAGNGDCDELAMQAFFPLLRYESDPQMRERWLKAWYQLYQSLQTQEDAFFDLITAHFLGDTISLGRVMRSFRDYPTDLIRFTMHGAPRLDKIPAPAYYLTKDQNADIHMRSDGHIFPADERPNDRHNTFQFRINGGWGAGVEMDSADILFVYWLGRYYGMIAAP